MSPDSHYPDQPPDAATLQKSVETLSFLLTESRAQTAVARSELSNLRLSSDSNTRYLTTELGYARDALASKEGVIAAVDRELAAARIIHASRALGVKQLAAHRDAAIEENERLRKLLDSRREQIHVDTTPDAGLPIRILTAYLDENSHTISEPPTLGQQMNQRREERNVIIRQALADLTAGRAGRVCAENIEQLAADAGKQITAAINGVIERAKARWGQPAAK